MGRQPKRNNLFWIELLSNSWVRIPLGSMKKEWFLSFFCLLCHRVEVQIFHTLSVRVQPFLSWLSLSLLIIDWLILYYWSLILILAVDRLLLTSLLLIIYYWPLYCWSFTIDPYIDLLILILVIDPYYWPSAIDPLHYSLDSDPLYLGSMVFVILLLTLELLLSIQ